MKKLSIVMPVFNCTEYVRVMIDSILANDFQDWELLAVDDGSEQDTLDLLAGYAERDSRIKFIQRDREPKGAQTCRNIGFERAEGEYIIFFDSDDYISPTCLGNRVSQLDSRPELDFMVFPSGVLENGEISTAEPKFCFGYDIFDDCIVMFAERILPFVVVNNIYRTESLRRHSITWDTNLRSMQDADFNLQTLLSGMHYSFAKCTPDYGYRRSGSADSVSKKIFSDQHLQSHQYGLEKFCSSIQTVYGNRYDRNLYDQTIYMFNQICKTSFNAVYVNGLCDILKRHNRSFGRKFALQIKLLTSLSRFLPYRFVRRVVFYSYLKYYSNITSRYKPEKISSQL